jgi:hypothetical protein
MRLKILAPLAVVVVAVAAGSVAQASTRGHNSLNRVRHATSQFQDLGTADSAGYQRFVDVNGIACIDMPGMGAMGVHYVNGGFVGDADIDPLTPEAMVYETDSKGDQHLVAVEYIVVKSAWDATHTSPPTLFGTTFDSTASPNRFGLPDFYSLHAWIFKHNPAGTVSRWNPRVNCDPHAGHDHSDTPHPTS